MFFIRRFLIGWTLGAGVSFAFQEHNNIALIITIMGAICYIYETFPSSQKPRN